MSPRVRKARIFYTDAEFEAAFGAQAAKATRMLSRYAAAICQGCGGECCRRIGCEFYSARFSTCPIFEYRPAKCRLYFCERILDNEKLTERERDILNQPAKDLSDTLKRGWGIGIFIEPPVKVGEKSWLTALGIEAQVSDIVGSLEKSSIGCDSARNDLLHVVQKSRRDT